MKKRAPKTKKLIPSSRSRLANGNHILPGTDGRSAEARRARDVFRQLCESCHGLAKMRPHEAELARRCGALVVLVERQERLLLSGDAAYDADVHLRAVGTLRRCFDGLSEDRASVPPDDDDDETFEDFMAKHARKAPHRRAKL